MHTRHRGQIARALARTVARTLAATLVIAACASSKGRRAGGTVLANRDPSDTTAGAYGMPRNSRGRSAKASRITQQDIERAGDVDLVSFLQARLPGVRVIGSRGDYAVVVSGVGSFQGNNAALVMVDGSEGSLSGLRLTDLASIELLKDSAAAVYGCAARMACCSSRRGSADPAHSCAQPAGRLRGMIRDVS